MTGVTGMGTEVGGKQLSLMCALSSAARYAFVLTLPPTNSASIRRNRAGATPSRR